MCSCDLYSTYWLFRAPGNCWAELWFAIPALGTCHLLIMFSFRRLFGQSSKILSTRLQEPCSSLSHIHVYSGFDIPPVMHGSTRVSWCLYFVRLLQLIIPSQPPLANLWGWWQAVGHSFMLMRDQLWISCTTWKYLRTLSPGLTYIFMLAFSLSRFSIALSLLRDEYTSTYRCKSLSFVSCANYPLNCKWVDKWP